MTDDLRPGMFNEIGTALAITEYPIIISEAIEPTEAPRSNPVLRFLRVTVLRPLIREFPHVDVE